MAKKELSDKELFALALAGTYEPEFVPSSEPPDESSLHKDYRQNCAGTLTGPSRSLYGLAVDLGKKGKKNRASFLKKICENMVAFECNTDRVWLTFVVAKDWKVYVTYCMSFDERTSLERLEHRGGF